MGQGAVSNRDYSIPVLCDVPDVEGAMAGMLAATRWSPLTSWLFLPGQQPFPSEEVIVWLLNQRRPGVRAVIPVLSRTDCPESVLAYYDLRSMHVLENLRSASLAGESRVIRPLIPECMLIG